MCCTTITLKRSKNISAQDKMAVTILPGALECVVIICGIPDNVVGDQVK